MQSMEWLEWRFGRAVYDPRQNDFDTRLFIPEASLEHSGCSIGAAFTGIVEMITGSGRYWLDKGLTNHISLRLLLAVLLAHMYFQKQVHKHMVLTGQTSIHGKVGQVAGIREKAMAGLAFFPDKTVNMVVPFDNTVGSAIWTDYCYIERDREVPHSVVRREWFTLEKDDRARLKVFAAQTLYDLLELAMISAPGKRRPDKTRADGGPLDGWMNGQYTCLTANVFCVYHGPYYSTCRWPSRLPSLPQSTCGCCRSHYHSG